MKDEEWTTPGERPACAHLVGRKKSRLFIQNDPPLTNQSILERSTGILAALLIPALGTSKTVAFAGVVIASLLVPKKYWRRLVTFFIPQRYWERCAAVMILLLLSLIKGRKKRH